MMKTSSTHIPEFVRISDRDLTEIELHSVESINDLHRINTEHCNKDSRPAVTYSRPTNGILQDVPIVCHTTFSKRLWWQSRIFTLCKNTRYHNYCGCVAITLIFIFLVFIFHFLARQRETLQTFSQNMRYREDFSLKLDQLLLLLKNLNCTQGS